MGVVMTPAMIIAGMIASKRHTAIIMAAVHSRCGHYIFALWFLSSIFFFSSPNLSGRRLDVYHTWCGVSANLECRSEMYCTRLAGNTGRKNDAISAPSHNFVKLYLRK